MSVFEKKDSIVKAVKEVIERYEKEGCEFEIFDLRFSVSLLNRVDELHIEVLCLMCNNALKCNKKEQIEEEIRMSVRKLFRNDLMLIKTKLSNIS